MSTLVRPATGLDRLPRAARIVLVTLPGLLLAAVGTTHPVFLRPDTAQQWQTGHLVLLPVFPLLAVSMWLVLRGERGPAAWGARLLALAYALLYGALDSIAGIGAAHQVLRTTARGDPRAPIEDLFHIADQLGALGVYSLAGSAVLAAGVLFQRWRSPLSLAGAAVVVAACYPFLMHHIFPPKGVLAVAVIGVGQGLLEASRGRRTG